MLFTISSFFLITASLHWVSCDNDLEVGTTKNCSDITKGQATFPVRYGNKDGCCVKEAKKLFENEDFTYPKRQLCCLPPGNKCRKGSTPCCNQLTCAFHGEKEPKCQQKRTYSVDEVREDSKSSCADPHRPLRVFLDITITVKDNKQYTIKDNIYCCDNKIKGKTAMGSFLKFCCGTQFAVCDDFKYQFTKKLDRKKKGYKPPLLQCCGQREVNRYQDHCTPVKPFTKDMYPEMNARYLAKKTGKPKSEFADAPLVERDGFGLCSYSNSGRWDVTKNLMKDAGYDIWAKCKEGKAGKADKGDAKNVKCSDTGDKKFLYHYKQHANLCCNKGSMMHRTEEEIKAGCCIHNYVTDKTSVSRAIPFLRFFDRKLCDPIGCCSGSCNKINSDSKCVETSEQACYVVDKRCTVSKPSETFADCFEDYDVFHPIDKEYERDSKP